MEQMNQLSELQELEFDDTGGKIFCSLLSLCNFFHTVHYDVLDFEHCILKASIALKDKGGLYVHSSKSDGIFPPSSHGKKSHDILFIKYGRSLCYHWKDGDLLCNIRCIKEPDYVMLCL